MKNTALYNKLFVADRFFTIAIRKCKNDDIVKNKQFTAEYVIPSTRQQWAADPMLVDAGDKTYLFYEAVFGDKGHLEVSEVLDDCMIGKPTVILQDECHYSYPFVFQHEDEWFMIPESSAVSEVRLYRAENFPDKWEMDSVLLHEKAVDTTIFEQDGQLYLLTYFLVPGSERVIPHAYKMHFGKERVELTEITWNKYDELRVRGAGPIFEVDKRLCRPAQINQEQRYGDGLAFYQVNAKDTYNESIFGELLSSNLEVSGYKVDGLHTYCQSKRFEAIDIRCCVIDYLKPMRKVISMLKR